MKKAAKFILISLLLSLLVSCATVGPTTVVGKWTFNDANLQYNLLFTTTGTYAYETIDKTDISKNDYLFGTYAFDNDRIYFDEQASGITYSISGKTLTFGGIEFTRTAYKVFDYSGNINGVWSINGESATIAFTSDGKAIAYDTELSTSAFGTYLTSAGKILANGKNATYMIIDDALYISTWDFINSKTTTKYTRLTSGGNNKSANYLCELKDIPYERFDYKTERFIGTYYTFLKDMTYTAFDTDQNTYSGTYSYDGTKISTSSGNDLTFMVIDNIPFGFEL